MNRKNLKILLISFVAGLAIVTSVVAIAKPDINKSVILQIIKYK